MDEHLSLSDLKITIASRCGIPLSWAVNYTVAQCLTILIQKEFRNRGYCVPYNSAKIEHPPFKGAFTSVDGDIEVGELAL